MPGWLAVSCGPQAALAIERLSYFISILLYVLSYPYFNSTKCFIFWLSFSGHFYMLILRQKRDWHNNCFLQIPDLFSCKISIGVDNLCVICSNMQWYAATNQYWSSNYHMHSFHQVILNYAPKYLKRSLSVHLSYLHHDFKNASVFQWQCCQKESVYEIQTTPLHFHAVYLKDLHFTNTFGQTG